MPMEPISLSHQPGDMPFTPPGPIRPRVFLDRLKEVELPKEGEIRFRYSRIKKIETETKTDETCDYELELHAITDICDCADKEPADKDAEESIVELMDELSEDDMVDESEDDNPAKY